MDPGSFLTELVMELENMDEADYHEPKTDQTIDDHYVGTLSEHLKRVYTLRDKYNRERVALLASTLVGDSHDSVDNCIIVSTLTYKYALLDALLWIDIHSEFKELTKVADIALRSGFRVVSCGEHTH